MSYMLRSVLHRRNIQVLRAQAFKRTFFQSSFSLSKMQELLIWAQPEYSSKIVQSEAPYVEPMRNVAEFS